MTIASKVSTDGDGLLVDESMPVPSDINQLQGQPPPDNYAVLAWFSCLCCCWPIGIFAIIASTSVLTKWEHGDFDGAYEASEKAKGISFWAIGVGGIVFVLYMMAQGSTT